jgi:hypothetical protein
MVTVDVREDAKLEAEYTVRLIFEDFREDRV